MQNFFKKSLAVLLVAIMALSVAPLAGLFVVANAETVVTGTCGADAGGANLTWAFDDATGELSIAGTGKMKNYASASATPWYNKTYGDNKSIIPVTVKIGADVTSIGDYAFSNCNAITEIIFEEGNAVTTIGGHAFFNCTSLNSVTLPASVRTIGVSAFSGSGITAFEFPAGVADLAPGLFENCKALETITFAEGSTLTTIENWAFNGCSALTGIALPATVTAICDYAFAGCASAASIEIPSTVTSLGRHTFTGCAALEEVVLPDSTSSIGDQYFAGCASLKSITIPAGVLSIGEEAFSSCTSLETITFAEGSELTSIGAKAFYNCSKLSAIAIPASVVDIGSKTVTENNVEVTYDYYHVFDLCTSLKSITVPAANANYSSDSVGALYNKAKTVLIKYPSACEATTYEIGKNVTEIKDYAFEACKNITAFTVESGSARFSADANGLLYYDAYAPYDPETETKVEVLILVQYPSGNEATGISLPVGLRAIKSKAFNDCPNLTSYIHIPSTVKAAGFATDSFVGIPEGCIFCCNDPDQSRDMKVYVIETLKRIAIDCSGHSAGCSHKWSETKRTESTCSAFGERILTCSICGDQKAEQLGKKNHTFGSAVVVQPTSCRRGEEGSSTITCSVCNEVQVTPISQPHTYAVNQAESFAATCDTVGKTVEICSVCSDRKETELDALGHKFGDWIVTTTDSNGNTVDSNNAPGKGGRRHHTCSVCNTTIEEILPPLPEISIDAVENPTAVYKGENLSLSCTVNNLGNFGILWECSDPEKATISVDPKDATKCTIKAIGHGKITITARVLTLGGADVKDGKGEVIDIRSSVECKASMTFWQQIVHFFRGILAKFSLGNIIG